MKRILLVLLCLAFTILLFGDNVYKIYVVKDPYPSASIYLFDHDSVYRVESTVDSDLTYWHALVFTDSDINIGNIYSQLKKTTGTAKSKIYDCETNTNCIYYLNAKGE